MKFNKKSYSGVKEILKTRDFEAIGVMVDDTGITANADGLKIVPAGTVVGGKTKSALENEDEIIQEKNTQAVAASIILDSTNANSDILVTAINAGTVGNSIKVELKDPSGINQALSVSVVGNAIVVSLATDGAGVITSTATDVIAAINAHLVAKDLVVAANADSNDGTGVVEAIVATALANGTNGTGVDAEGVLLCDVDVTYGSAPGSMVIRGNIDLDKIATAPCADAMASLKNRVIFIK